jgi:hypothetical protein
MAERARRYRRKKRLNDVRPIIFRPVTPLFPPVTKTWRPPFDARALIA